jgi:proteasome lid subunit RPN8/RPN11
MTPRLVLAAEQRAALRAAAESAYPDEFCALLIGTAATASDPARVTRIVLADNVAPEPHRGFELDPRVLIAVLRALREAERTGQGGGERLLGHVHSHPDAPARPSATDRALAHEPGLFWLILAVHQGKAGELNGFQAVTGTDGQGDFVGAVLEA